jgi:hypothetical protein
VTGSTLTFGDDPLGILISFHMAGAYSAVLGQALEMDQAGFRHPLLALMLAEAAFREGDDIASHRGLALIDEIYKGDPEAQRIMIEFTRDVFMTHVAPAYGAGQSSIVLGYLEIARRVLPELVEVFGHSSEAPQSPQPPVQRLSLPMPPGRQAKPGRRLLFFMRKFYFGPHSREHDFGARMCHGMARGGWVAKAVDPTYQGRTHIEARTEDLMDLALDFQADIILIDFCGLVLPPYVLIEFIEQCRRRLPGTKIVFIHFDPWQRETWASTRSLAKHVDLIWSHFPSIPLWAAPELESKVSLAPFPVGVGVEEMQAIARRPVSVFQGAIENYNATRAFWLAALEQKGAPISVRLTDHQDDGLSAIDSYRKYLEGFFSVDRLVNFAMRQDGSRIITGRTFEAIHAGACLIQEQAADVDYYFEPGVDYFRFTTLGELEDILNRVEREPELARRTGQKAQAYYRDHYDDELLVAHLDQVLFNL